MRRGHPRVRRRLTAELFRSERHVDTELALGKPGIGHRHAEEALSRDRLVRNVAVTVPTFAAAVMVAASTDLIAGVPRRVVEVLRGAVPITVVEGPTAALRLKMHLVWHARTHVDPAAASFRELIADAFRVTR